MIQCSGPHVQCQCSKLGRLPVCHNLATPLPTFTNSSKVHHTICGTSQWIPHTISTMPRYSSISLALATLLLWWGQVDTTFQTPTPRRPSESPTTLRRATLSTPHTCHTIIQTRDSSLTPPTLFLRWCKMSTTACTTLRISLSAQRILPYTVCTITTCMVDLCKASF